jgi:SAM-dependent methyltransferase
MKRARNDRDVWLRKPALRSVYAGYYNYIHSVCREGKTLEIGGGPGNLRDWFGPGVVSTDIQFASWLDAVADAQMLPFADGSFDNLVMVDVLHHLNSVKEFFGEVQRVVKPGGRIVLVEPAITLFSRLFYTFLHSERLDMSQNPLSSNGGDVKVDPYDANQAIPTLLFGRFRGDFQKSFPLLVIREKRWMSLFAYPLSGGFQSWSVIPARLVKPVLWCESLLAHVVGPAMAFRLAVVIERL